MSAQEGRLQDERPKRGVKTKILGIVLIFLGALNSLASWRAGIVLSDFYVILFASGVALYAIGAIRGGRGG